MVRIGKKKQFNKGQQKQLLEIIHQETSRYISKDDLKRHLEEIDRDEQRKKIWDSLSTRRKIQVLRHALAKRGKADGKKS